MSGNETIKSNSAQFSEKLRNELEKLTGSINEIMLNMKKMQNPLVESREKLPIANKQLDKITAQTEQATHKMLDMVEQIIEHQEQITQLTADLGQFFKKSRSKERDINADRIKRVNEMASVSQNNAFIIMDALQFQDITSQQIQHASILLEDIGIRLHQLLAAFEGGEISDEMLQSKLSKRAYDPNADLFNGKDQREVDDIISKINAKS